MTLIAQLSDIHFGAEDVDAIEKTEAFLKDINPDLLVVCGDLTQRGRNREFEAAAEWLAGFDFPKLVVPGNHDTPMLNLAVRTSDPFSRFTRHFGLRFQQARVDNLIAVGLNTARGWQMRRNWAEGSVNLDELDTAIVRAGQSDADVQVLVCHHPFHSNPDAPLRTRTRRGRRAGNKIAASDVQLVLSGHVHTPSAVLRKQENGAYLAVSSGTLSTRLRTEPPSFNLIRLEKSMLKIDRCDLHNDGPVLSSMGTFDAKPAPCP